MKYTELRMQVRREHLEEIEAMLIEAGFDSVQIDDPLDALDIAEHKDLYKYDYINEDITQAAAAAERDQAGGVTVILFFADDEEGQSRLDEAKSRAVSYAAERGFEVVCESAVTGDDSEWLYKWQEHFKPTKLGDRIVVRPGWEEYDAKEGELVIEMDPGMAFGSGLHETTRMCIEGLEKALSGELGISFEGRAPKVLDVGTGTGILSIAAALLGADECLGIDIDDEAVRVASENIEKNQLSGKISVMKGDLMAGVLYEPDIIVANLMADLVMKLSPAAFDHLSAGGLFISSGILDIKTEVVAEAIERAGFEILHILADGEWRAVIAVRKTVK